MGQIYKTEVLFQPLLLNFTAIFLQRTEIFDDGHKLLKQQGT